MLETFELGDLIQTKKPHACGANSWRIIRVGADVKIKCTQCARIIMMDREEFTKKAKKKLEG